MTIKGNGEGAVLPGSPVATLPAGKVTITIESAPGENDGLFARDDKGDLVLENGNPVPAPSENVMVRCVYPDGFTKNHQTNSPQDLFGKVASQLRNRYGVTGEIKVVKLPDAVTAGATIEVEV